MPLVQNKWKLLRCIVLGNILLSIIGCSRLGDDEDLVPILDPLFNNITFFRFNEDSEGWIGTFVEYPGEREDSLQLNFSHSELPPIFEKEGNALRWSGFNFYNSLFMLGHYQLTNLEPNTEYVFSFDVEAGYEILQGNQFLLGDHEQRIFIKAGVVNFEPFTFYNEVSGRVESNIDQGIQQSVGGDHMRILGSIDVGELSQKDKILSNPIQVVFPIRSNAQGEVWLLVGAESSVPLRQAFYLDTIIAYFDKAE